MVHVTHPHRVTLEATTLSNSAVTLTTFSLINIWIIIINCTGVYASIAELTERKYLSPFAVIISDVILTPYASNYVIAIS